MFRTVLLKTMYEKRWFMLIWGIGVAAMALLMMAFYHSFSDGAFDEAFKNLPQSMQGLVGNLASLKTVPGYVSQQVFALRIPLLTLIMGSVLFSGLLAGDEGDGTLQTLLAQPISRLRLFVEKYLAGLLVSLVVCSMAIIGVWIGLLAINEQMGFVRLFQAVLGVWLLTVLFGTIGFAVGAMTGKKGMAGSVAGLIAFGTYLVTSFVTSVSWLVDIEKLSPFHYYNNPSIAEFGLRMSNVVVMTSVIGVLLIVSAISFVKRDIYQR